MKRRLRKLGRWILAFITWPFRTLRNLVRRVRDFFREEPDDATLADSLQKATENPYGILEHLNALRKHVFRALGAWLLLTVLAFTFVTPLMDWLAMPIGGIGELQAVEVTEPIGVVMRVSLLAGFTVALPYIGLELLLFVAPALKPRGRLVGILGIPMIFVFFLAGMAFSYYLMLPVALPVLLNFMGIPTIPRPSSYISFVTGLMFWIGIAFEMPLLSFLLSSMGLLKGHSMRKNWRYAVFFIAVVAAMITPTIDPVNMLIVMGPLLLLYGLSILMAYAAKPKQPAEAPA
jgi:sec-independent protein translocase protein TatC